MVRKKDKSRKLSPTTMANSQTKNSPKPYNKPTLTEYGQLRDLTLAPTPGIYESGQGIGWKWNWNP